MQTKRVPDPLPLFIASPGGPKLFDEMTTFPCGEHADLPDAAAFGTAYRLDRPQRRVW